MRRFLVVQNSRTMFSCFSSWSSVTATQTISTVQYVHAWFQWLQDYTIPTHLAVTFHSLKLTTTASIYNQFYTKHSMQWLKKENWITDTKKTTVIISYRWLSKSRYNVYVHLHLRQLLRAIQGHSRSSVVVLIDVAYMTSYEHSTVT